MNGSYKNRSTFNKTVMKLVPFQDTVYLKAYPKQLSMRIVILCIAKLRDYHFSMFRELHNSIHIKSGSKSQSRTSNSTCTFTFTPAPNQ